MGVKQKLRDEVEALEQTVRYFELKQQYEELGKQVDAEKKKFYASMESEYENGNFDGSSYDLVYGYDTEDSTRAVGGSFKIVRQVKRQIKWDLKKLLRNVGKKSYNEITDRSYEVIDFTGLAKYVKSLGGEPDIFKSFFNVTETVDEKKIDELGELGEIDTDQLSGCYEVIEGKPWFRISFKASEADGE